MRGTSPTPDQQWLTLHIMVGSHSLAYPELDSPDLCDIVHYQVMMAQYLVNALISEFQ